MEPGSHARWKFPECVFRCGEKVSQSKAGGDGENLWIMVVNDSDRWEGQHMYEWDCEKERIVHNLKSIMGESALLI